MLAIYLMGYISSVIEIAESSMCKPAVVTCIIVSAITSIISRIIIVTIILVLTIVMEIMSSIVLIVMTYPSVFGKFGYYSPFENSLIEGVSICKLALQVLLGFSYGLITDVLGFMFTLVKPSGIYINPTKSSWNIPGFEYLFVSSVCIVYL